MSDVGDMYADVRRASIERRARNRVTSPDVLRHHGVAFEEKNDGAHLIVKFEGVVADFWPGTGTYIPRNAPHKRGRGVFNLLRYLRAANCKGPTHGTQDPTVQADPGQEAPQGQDQELPDPAAEAGDAGPPW